MLSQSVVADDRQFESIGWIGTVQFDPLRAQSGDRAGDRRVLDDLTAPDHGRLNR
jgi:hypothetical protein